MISLPGTGLIGVATSKKLGCAPDRNLIKRRFRESIRTQPDLANSTIDVVILASSGASSASFQRIQEEVRRMFEETTRRWASESESS
jgi:ribonuclease P protein component